MDSNMKSVLRSYLAKCGDGQCKFLLNFDFVSLPTLQFSLTGRGLEKFLRRNSYSSDSSTRDTSTPITTKSRNKTKSLESLTDKKENRHASPKSLKQDTKSLGKEEEKKPEGKKPMDQTKVIVKQSGEKLDKKKSQFNYESIIEITLPSAPTPANPLPILENKSHEEEPIKPILCTPKIPPHNNANMSPSESCVSNKQNPLEWDSFLPVSIRHCFFYPRQLLPIKVHFHFSF